MFSLNSEDSLELSQQAFFCKYMQLYTMFQYRNQRGQLYYNGLVKFSKYEGSNVILRSESRVITF